MDNNEFRESCSCLEGNPCVDKYNCKDWENRRKLQKKFEKERDERRVCNWGFRAPFKYHLYRIRKYPERNNARIIRIIDLINNESS